MTDEAAPLADHRETAAPSAGGEPIAACVPTCQAAFYLLFHKYR